MADNDYELSVFCDNVRFLRKAHGLSQKEMAKIMGIGVGGLRIIERGTVPPRLDVFVLICLSDHFHISCDSLFCLRCEADFAEW